jgi:RNase P subunit RPR2
LAKEIPEKIALAARKHDAIVLTPPDQLKKCYTCGRMLPANNLFFVKNRSRKDKLSSNCKECERKRRIEKGG